MKVLHIFDIAGVAYTLSKYLNRVEGIEESTVINQFDPFHYHDVYRGGNIYEPDQVKCRERILELAPEYDILHVHMNWTIIPELLQFNKPVVIQYHGSELMQEMLGPRTMRKAIESKCALSLVVNDYMLGDNRELLPNPVDTELFKPMFDNNSQRIFTYSIPTYLNPLPSLGFNYEVYERKTDYWQMPEFLRRFGGYIDIKHHKEQGLLPALSKTGLEALACGLRVLNYKHEWIKGLPERHKPENVVSSLVSKYEEILDAHLL